ERLGRRHNDRALRGVRLPGPGSNAAAKRQIRPALALHHRGPAPPNPALHPAETTQRQRRQAGRTRRNLPAAVCGQDEGRAGAPAAVSLILLILKSCPKAFRGWPSPWTGLTPD